jgi:putative phosphoribosyl transferase
MELMEFENRREAGRVLARMMTAEPDLEDAVVLGLPRGGVPVALEIAHTLRVPLDVMMVRKLGAPGAPELAMGALASGGVVVLNPAVLRAFHVSPEALEMRIAEERAALENRELLYRNGRPAHSIAGRAVILVDDGLATGASMRAAIHVVNASARRVIAAVPAGARSTCEELQREGVRVVCALVPDEFRAVGIYYRDFRPTSDEEVCALLAEARRETGTGRKWLTRD